MKILVPVDGCELALDAVRLQQDGLRADFVLATVIMGARGMGSLRSALLGWVSQAVLHVARVPVTIVKHAEEAAPAA